MAEGDWRRDPELVRSRPTADYLQTFSEVDYPERNVGDILPRPMGSAQDPELVKSLPVLLYSMCPEHEEIFGNYVDFSSGLFLPWEYIYGPGSATPGHVEDSLLASVNVNFGPGFKLWFMAAQSSFGDVLRFYNGRPGKCKHPYFTKIGSPLPELLMLAGVPVYSFIQGPNSTVFLDSGVWHLVINVGYGYSFARNVISPSWLYGGWAEIGHNMRLSCSEVTREADGTDDTDDLLCNFLERSRLTSFKRCFSFDTNHTDEPWRKLNGQVYQISCLGKGEVMVKGGGFVSRPPSTIYCYHDGSMKIKALGCTKLCKNPWRGRVERNAATKERNPVDLSKKGALPVVVVPDLSVQLGIDGSDKKANVDGSRQEAESRLNGITARVEEQKIKLENIAIIRNTPGTVFLEGKGTQPAHLTNKEISKGRKQRILPHKTDPVQPQISNRNSNEPILIKRNLTSSPLWEQIILRKVKAEFTSPRKKSTAVVVSMKVITEATHSDKPPLKPLKSGEPKVSSRQINMAKARYRGGASVKEESLWNEFTEEAIQRMESAEERPSAALIKSEMEAEVIVHKSDWAVSEVDVAQAVRMDDNVDIHSDVPQQKELCENFGEAVTSVERATRMMMSDKAKKNAPCSRDQMVSCGITGRGENGPSVSKAAKSDDARIGQLVVESDKCLPVDLPVNICEVEKMEHILSDSSDKRCTECGFVKGKSPGLDSTKSGSRRNSAVSLDAGGIRSARDESEDCELVEIDFSKCRKRRSRDELVAETRPTREHSVDDELVEINFSYRREIKIEPEDADFMPFERTPSVKNSLPVEMLEKVDSVKRRDSQGSSGGKRPVDPSTCGALGKNVFSSVEGRNGTKAMSPRPTKSANKISAEADEYADVRRKSGANCDSSKCNPVLVATESRAGRSNTPPEPKPHENRSDFVTEECRRRRSEMDPAASPSAGSPVVKNECRRTSRSTSFGSDGSPMRRLPSRRISTQTPKTPPTGKPERCRSALPKMSAGKNSSSCISQRWFGRKGRSRGPSVSLDKPTGSDGGKGPKDVRRKRGRPPTKAHDLFFGPQESSGERNSCRNRERPMGSVADPQPRKSESNVKKRRLDV